MLLNNRLAADLAKVASGIVHLGVGLASEFRNRLAQRVSVCVPSSPAVSQEEFLVMQAMVKEARLQQEILKQEPAALKEKQSLTEKA